MSQILLPIGTVLLSVPIEIRDAEKGCTLSSQQPCLENSRAQWFAWQVAKEVRRPINLDNHNRVGLDHNITRETAHFNFIFVADLEHRQRLGDLQMQLRALGSLNTPRPHLLGNCQYFSRNFALQVWLFDGNPQGRTCISG